MLAEPFPFWYISFYIFSGVFNLIVSLIMFYLRSKGGTDKYTKSQLWALSILGFLFFLNFLITLTEAVMAMNQNQGRGLENWGAQSLWAILTIFTAFLLLSFGLVYPRPFTRWNKLRPFLIFILFVGLITVGLDIQDGHKYLRHIFPGFDITVAVYIFAVYIPIFIWLSEYSRQPSTEGRMMYTILIWGFLFAIFTFNAKIFIQDVMNNSSSTPLYTVNYVLLFLVLVKLSWSLRKLRKRWATPEKANVLMVILSLVISIITAFSSKLGYDPNTAFLIERFFGQTFGWALVRPALFSYGLLRFRFLGSQIKAERNISLLGAILSSSLICIFIINLSGDYGNPGIVAGAVLLSIVLLYPFLKVSESVVTRILPLSAGIKGVSMRERRNTYLMGLQTGVIKGDLSDVSDAAALEELRVALGVTEREHQLLLRSIAEQESRRKPGSQVEEVYLIFRDGRLLAHYIAGAEASGMDRDIVAGMFSAISEYVKSAMKSEDKMGRMDTLSYGASSLVIETYKHLVLAVVVRTTDDLVVRHSMRDTLSEIYGKYKKVLGSKWDGDKGRIEGTGEILRQFADRVNEN